MIKEAYRHNCTVLQYIAKIIEDCQEWGTSKPCLIEVCNCLCCSSVEATWVIQSFLTKSARALLVWLSSIGASFHVGKGRKTNIAQVKFSEYWAIGTCHTPTVLSWPMSTCSSVACGYILCPMILRTADGMVNGSASAGRFKSGQSPLNQDNVLI